MKEAIRNAGTWVLSLAVAWAASWQAEAGTAAQTVQMPYVTRDPAGGQWTIQADGSLEIAGRHFHNGGHLQLNGSESYSPEVAQATIDPVRNELTLPAVPVAGLNVSRRVRVNIEAGWCRFVEVLENPGAAPVRVRLQMYFSPGGGFQTTQPITDDRRGRGGAGTPIGLAVFDGDDGAVTIGAGRGSKLVPRITPQPDNGLVELAYDVEVPARQTVAVVHIQIHRPNYNEALDLATKTKDRDWLRDLPKQLLSRVVNFRAAGQFVGDVEILRGGLQDVVELRGGDQYKGTLADKAFRLQTAFGPMEVPAERVVSVLTAGEYRPTRLLVLADGQVVGGDLRADALRLQLSTGQVTSVPLANVTRVGLRRRPDEPEEWKLDARPMVFLRDGQRFEVRVPDGPLPVATRYGLLNLRPASVAAVTLHGDGQAVHEVELTDGSRFAGLLSLEALELKPANLPAAATASGGAVRVPVAAVSRIQFGKAAGGAPADTTAAGAANVSDDRPRLALSNGDTLVGSLAGTIILETSFDALTINAAEVHTLRHGHQSAEADAGAGAVPSPSEVQVTLSDGATFSGRLRGGVLDCVLGCGEALKVPVSFVAEYVQPSPQPPAEVAARVEALVKQLAATDWRQRDRATAEIVDVGPVAAAVLKSARARQPPEAQARIDEILAKFAAARKPAGPSPIGGNEPVRILPVEPAVAPEEPPAAQPEPADERG